MINLSVILPEDAAHKYEAELDQYIQEVIYMDGYSENDASDLLDRLAKDDGLEIDWDKAPKKLLWSIYQSTEKGLS